MAVLDLVCVAYQLNTYSSCRVSLSVSVWKLQLSVCVHCVVAVTRLTQDWNACWMHTGCTAAPEEAGGWRKEVFNYSKVKRLKTHLNFTLLRRNDNGDRTRRAWARNKPAQDTGRRRQRMRGVSGHRRNQSCESQYDGRKWKQETRGTKQLLHKIKQNKTVT